MPRGAKPKRRYSTLPTLRAAVREECTRWFREVFGIDWKDAKIGDQHVEREMRRRFEALVSAFKALRAYAVANDGQGAQCATFVHSTLLPALSRIPEMRKTPRWRSIPNSPENAAIIASRDVFDQMLATSLSKRGAPTRRLETNELARIALLLGAWPTSCEHISAPMSVEQVIERQRRNLRSMSDRRAPRKRRRRIEQ